MTRYSLVIAFTMIVSCFVQLTIKGQTGTLPIMYIETINHQAITSKTVYIPGTYYIVESAESGIVDSVPSPMPLEIRGRGHSSWRGTKKPYKLRLGEKAPLLGMNEHRHWALLKFNEPTVAGMQLGRLLNMDWTPSTQPLEVVLNGQNLGLYFLTETNRISKQRLNIYEQPSGNEDESTIPYGWLVEIDNYLESNQIKVRENDDWLLYITYHSPDSLSQAQKTWLTEEFAAMNKAIYDADKAHSTWEQFLDVEAMARFFIVQEVLDNTDGFHGSFYLHKDRGDDARWMAGPLWDLSCGQREKTDYTFRMKAPYGFNPHWIGELIKDEDFCQAVKDAWEEFYPFQIQSWMDYIDDHLLLCSEAFEQEKKLWKYTNQDSLVQRVEKLKTALLDNIEWFNDHLPVPLPDAINSMEMADRNVIKVEYINMSGMHSSKPWKGVNIKETTYDDGHVVTSKIIIRK